MAIREGKQIVTTGKWSYFRHRGCAEGSNLACYFQPFHSEPPPRIDVLGEAEYTGDSTPGLHVD